MEIFINRPIRLKKFDPVGGTRNEIRSTRNQFSGFVRLAIVMHPYEYSTAGGGPFMKRCSRRNAHFDRRERSLSSAYLRVSPTLVPKNRSDFIDRTSSLFLFSFFRKLRPRQGIEAREKSSRIHFFAILRSRSNVIRSTRRVTRSGTSSRSRARAFHARHGRRFTRLSD